MVLGSLGRDLAETVPPLHNALQDKDEAVRRLAAEALGPMVLGTSLRADGAARLFPPWMILRRSWGLEDFQASELRRQRASRHCFLRG